MYGQEKELIGLFLISWFFVKFEPIQTPIKKLIPSKYLLTYWLRSLLTCWFCFSLWFSLAVLCKLYGLSIEVFIKSCGVSFVAWLIQLNLKNE